VLPCDRHDDCYQTCDPDENARLACDERFRDEMTAACDGLEGVVHVHDPGEPDGTAEVPRTSVCRTFAELYHVAVHSFGPAPFENGQRDHCQCCA
jgi:hypothetical protein